jgi:hypothetical protein
MPLSDRRMTKAHLQEPVDKMARKTAAKFGEVCVGCYGNMSAT